MNLSLGERQGYISLRVVWFRKYERGPGWILKTPLCRPLFSERLGYDNPVWKSCGFRIFRLLDRWDKQL